MDCSWQNALRLAQNIPILILDHHLLRCIEGLTWLKDLSKAAKRGVFCAAQFMGRMPLLLEAHRADLYRDYPVFEGWHGDYAKGRAGTRDFGTRDKLGMLGS